jgi:hypothetical protein
MLARKLLATSAAVLAFAASAAVRADQKASSSETPPSLILSADLLAHEDWWERTQQQIDLWLERSGEKFLPRSASPKRIKLTRKLVGEIVSHGVGISHEILRDGEAVETYRHAQWTRELSPLHAPGVAIVAMGDRSKYSARYEGARRHTGALGLQLPLLGSRKLKLEDGEERLVLRILPIAASDEKARTGFYRGERTSDPDAEIRQHAMLETELDAKHGAFEPGARALIQTGTSGQTETRVLAEIYVKIEIDREFDDFKEISITPRCAWDTAWGGGHPAIPEDGSASFGGGYEKLHSVRVCSLSIRFKYGKAW